MSTDPVAEPSGAGRLTLHRLDGGDDGEAFARDVAAGLTSRPKTLKPKYFYDALGSLLFDAICLLPEYYLTRAESEILARRAEEMVARLRRPVRLLELGSGSSVKTRHLIEALLRRQDELHYLPLDISPSALEWSAEALLGTYSRLWVSAIAADYHQALSGLAADGWPRAGVPPAGVRPAGAPHSVGPRSGAPRAGAAAIEEGSKLVLFLGSTLGNLTPPEQRQLLLEIRAVLGAGDGLLLGADLKKPAAELVAAYDDPLGVTAAFNLNLLLRINRELGGGFDLSRFRHRAVYNEAEGRIEMHLVSRLEQTVAVADLDLEVSFAAGETVHTENSHKFDLQGLAALARETGFDLAETWLDDAGRFSVNLLLAAG